MVAQVFIKEVGDMTLSIFKAPEPISGPIESQEINDWLSFLDNKMSKEHMPTISVKEFGAAGDGLTDDTQAIKDAMAFASENEFALNAPQGIYLLSDTLRPPSNLYMFGDGVDNTVFIMDSSVPREVSVIVTGTMGDPRQRIKLEDFTIDFNKDRWDITGATTDYHSDSQQSGLVVAATEVCWVRRVESKWARKHGFDVSGSSNMRGDSNPLIYSPHPSRYVWVEDCIASNFGDDGITTHMSSHVWINNCIAMDAEAEFADNSNGFEIDDGSRNIWVHNCTAYRCNDGLEIKGHADTPAPYNIYVTGTFKAVNCALGLDITHIGHRESSEPQSATARNIFIDTIHIIAAKKINPNFVSETRYVRVHAYDNVHISKVIITDGKEDLDNQEYLPADDLVDENLFWIYWKARNVNVDYVYINGHPEAAKGVYITGSAGRNHYFGHVKVRNGPVDAFQSFTDAGPTWLMSYDIEGSQSNGIAVNMGGSASHTNLKYVGPGRMVGYSHMRWNAQDFTTPVVGFPLAVRSAGTIQGSGS